MNLKSAFAFTGIVLLIFSCNRANEKEKLQNLSVTEFKTQDLAAATDSIPVQSAPDQNPPAVKKDEKDGPASKEVKQPFIDWDKKIIKTATLSVEVKDFAGFSLQAKALSRKFGGYIANEEQEQNDYKVQNSLSIKVPVAAFEDAMNELSGIASKIVEKKITSEDVTTGLVDTKSRIEAKKQVRDKYLEFLKQAKNMEEVLNVQSEINGIQEELETAGGRVQYLSHSAAYSTINLTYFQVLDAKAEVADEPTFSGKAGDAFGKGWHFIKELLLGLLTIWPVLLLIVTGWVFLKKSRSKLLAAKEEKKD